MNACVSGSVFLPLCLPAYLPACLYYTRTFVSPASPVQRGRGGDSGGRLQERQPLDQRRPDPRLVLLLLLASSAGGPSGRPRHVLRCPQTPLPTGKEEPQEKGGISEEVSATWPRRRRSYRESEKLRQQHPIREEGDDEHGSRW